MLNFMASNSNILLLIVVDELQSILCLIPVQFGGDLLLGLLLDHFVSTPI